MMDIQDAETGHRNRCIASGVGFDAQGAMFCRVPHLRPILLATLLSLPLATTGCHPGGGTWHGTDVSGSTPDLAFTLSRSGDGRSVTAADFRGKVTLLYFGYTYCPDVCPTTLANVAQALKQAGSGSSNARVLFVTVDPRRDTLPVLAQYAKAFGPDFVGLRGTDDELATLAKRYRIAYSATPNSDPAKYEVTHSSAIYVFDQQGRARLLETSLSQARPDIAGTAADLERLLAG